MTPAQAPLVLPGHIPTRESVRRAPPPPPSPRRVALRALSNVMIVSGCLLLTDAAATLTWQEPVSALYARAHQSSLSGELTSHEDLTSLQLGALERLDTEQRRILFLARALQREAKAGRRTGKAIGRISSPKLRRSTVIVEGTDGETLRKGPGHYPDTRMPGKFGTGTVAIAGHRTTYGAPFRHLDKVRKGDPIVVEMPYGRFTYRTVLNRIVGPSEYDYVTRNVGYNRLALTACHPLYSAAQRIVVFARLESVEARGRARVADSLAPGRIGSPPRDVRPYWPSPLG